MQSDGSYAYAKACGILGKSFLGKRLSLLEGLHSLGELDRLIFPENHGELPGMELLKDMEHRITSRTVKQIFTVIDSYANPPEILIQMLRAYELSDLKTCLHQIVSYNKNVPVTCNLERFASIRFDAFPDLKAMLKNSQYISLLLNDIEELKPGADITPLEVKIDKIYYTGLIKSLKRISSDDREKMKKVIEDEISLRNCSWALRLRTYFHKDSKEAGEFLMDIENTSLVKDAESSLNLPLDTRNSWKGWRWEKFLNPEESAVHWTVDPRHFQNAASQYLYRLVHKYFYRSPLTITSIFCFAKLKQFEEDLLTSMAEGLALGMDSAGIFSLLEVSR